MADTVQRVEYFYAQVPNKAGEGARFLTALQEAGINLLAFSGFPEGRGSQLDFVPADPAAFKRFARTAKWKLTGPKRGGRVAPEARRGEDQRDGHRRRLRGRRPLRGHPVGGPARHEQGRQAPRHRVELIGDGERVRLSCQVPAPCILTGHGVADPESPCDERGAAGYASPRYRRIITEGVPRSLYMHLHKTHDGITFRVIRHDATPFCGLLVDCLISGATRKHCEQTARTMAARHDAAGADDRTGGT